MKKYNKKGFTLIEMLVVIAIIAILVAIIVPAVGKSTVKSAAASNAANMRSWKAELTTAFLADEVTADSSGNLTIPADIETPPTKKMGSDVATSDKMTAKFNTASNEILVTLKGKTINQIAYIAEHGGTFAKIPETVK